MVKFMFSKKAQKSTKSSPSIWRLLSKRQIDGEDFFNFCDLLRKHELYTWIKLHIFLTILYSVYIVGTWKPNGLEKRVYMPRIIKEKKHTGRHKRTSNGKSMQQQCTLSIVWSQAFSFPASVRRYYRAKWLPSKVC